MDRIRAWFAWAAVMGTLMLVHACAPVQHSRHASPMKAPVAGDPNAVIFRAISLVGTPYRYGGNTPEGGFDCSGLVAYVFRDTLALALPRRSAEIGALELPRVGRARLRPGDLVFFAGGREIDHVGIYVGEDRFVHAPNSGGTVRLDSLDGPYWRDNFRFGRRLLQ
ncbi:MAG TPA: C40 family peptidase [Xanthomonadaceae bacterium]|nr:C40 family peptidase [Xanthomonadaceae bacterium]